MAKMFAKMLNAVKEYFRLMRIRREDSELSHSAVARMAQDVPFGTARTWVSGRRTPELINQVVENEVMRRKLESKQPTRALENLIDSSTVFRALRSIRNRKRHSVGRMARALEHLLARTPIQRVAFAHLKPYNYNHGPRWLLDVRKSIQANRKQIEEKLNKNLGLDVNPDEEMRIAVVGSLLYFWRKDTRKFNYLNLFADELFFFGKRERKPITREGRNFLGLNGDYDLSNVVRQLADYQEKVTGREGRIISDFTPNSAHLRGRTLQLLMDAQGKSLKDVESGITRLGQGRQIVRPKFLIEVDFITLMARLFAIVASDGSIESGHRIFYYENDATRRTIVRSMLQRIGEVATPIIRNRNKSEGGFHVPNIIGRLLARLGMTVGDKVLQGVRLPDWIKYGSSRVQLAYLCELVPEEGSVAVDAKDYARITWSRSVVLHDPLKADKYRFVSRLTGSQVDFIKKHGKPTERRYGRDAVEGRFRELSITMLESLMESEDSADAKAAKELDYIVRTNPSGFVEDEKQLCLANGIMTKEQDPSYISYSEQTGRVSVKWTTATSSQEDVAMWGIQAPPNDKRKRRILEKWMKAHPRRVKEARNKIEQTQKWLELTKSPELEAEDSG
ncbi:MAG: hypothetical protein ACE5H4_02580 [Candidatus Thorarchaeota archaeon]